MTYQVLARKWRPQKFSEVVGQGHITQTLQNAIKQERVGHAYLFVGARGIGKTTTARIFAKALNCEDESEPEPCCECRSCREIANGSSLDVMEMDGASHNRVEHIRDIRDNVQYTPSQSKYKIYIIDEVHMLTPAAWNALLKTLEEPPQHAKFFFATTEPHKVLPTIVSRCQRFDLKRISVPLIVGHLKKIAESEQINIEERAVAAIARAADGGMRDAQSIFDQMIAFCGGDSADDPITEQNVIDVFGLASGSELEKLASGLVLNDANQVMTVVQKLADRGRDLERLFEDIMFFIRNLMISAVCSDPSKLIEASESELSDMAKMVSEIKPGVLQRMLESMVASEGGLRNALNKRVHLEATLVRVMTEAHSVQIDDVIARLNSLRGEGTIPRGDKSADSPARAQKTEKGEKKPSPSSASTESESQKKQEARATPSADKTADHRAKKKKNTPKKTDPTDNEKKTRPDSKSLKKVQNPDKDSLWKATLEQLNSTEKSISEGLTSCLKAVKPASYTPEDGMLIVGYSKSLSHELKEILLSEESGEILQNAFAAVCGAKEPRLVIKQWVDSVSNDNGNPEREVTPEMREKIVNNPFVKHVQEMFHGEIVDVRI